MELAEARLGRPLREALLTEFRAMTSAEIGRALGVSPRTLERWMVRLGLERRSVIVAVHDDDATSGRSGRGENHEGLDPRPLPGEIVGVEAQGG